MGGAVCLESVEAPLGAHSGTAQSSNPSGGPLEGACTKGSMRVLNWQNESRAAERGPMHFEKFSFGSIQIDGVVDENDVVIDRGEVWKRKKARPKTFASSSSTRHYQFMRVGGIKSLTPLRSAFSRSSSITGRLRWAPVPTIS